MAPIPVFYEYDREKRSVVRGLQSLRDADVLYEELSVTLQTPPDRPEGDSNTTRLRQLFEGLHRRAAGPAAEKRAALCVSGGGIRSATFSLGVIQGLAKKQLLARFHYLSTVSGGGYVGSWLTAASHRHPGGIEGFSHDLQRHGDDRQTSPGGGPAAVARLRDFSHFLSPRFGPLKADTWTLLAIAFRNVIANWLVLLPILLTIAGFTVVGAALLQFMPFLHPAVLVFNICLMGAAVACSHHCACSKHTKLTERGSVGLCALPLFAGAILASPFLGHSGSERVPQSAAGWFATVGFIHVSFWAMGLLFAVVDELPERRVWRRWQLRAIWLSAAMVGGGVTGLALIEGQLIVAALQNVWLEFIVGPPVVVLALLAGGLAYVVMASWPLRAHQMEWYARLAAWMLILIVVWTIFTSLIIGGGWAVASTLGGERRWLFGTVIVGLGMVATLAARWSRGRQSRLALLARFVASGTAPAFLMVLVALLGAFWFLLSGMPDNPQLTWQGPPEWFALTVINQHRFLLLTAAGLLVGALFLDYIADLNEFTPHVMYRDRLVRAYISAPSDEQSENSFTGFDQGADVQLWQLRPGLFRPPDAKSVSTIGDWLIARVDDRPRETLSQRLVQLRAARRQVRDPGESIGSRLHRYLPKNEWVHAGLMQKRGAWNSVVLEIAAENGTKDPEKAFTLAAFRSARAELLAAAHREAGAAEPKEAAELQQAFDELAKGRSDARILYPVLNTTLNLVSGGYLRWQQRKAESFAFTPMHAGASSIGSRRLAEMSEETQKVEFYGGTEQSGVTLGTAAAISGAAANPSMGAMSSPAVTFLLTFFNARLGRWVANPRQESAYSSIPFFTAPLLAAEAMGLTNAERRWVNLSDGGHFENLALYEMVWSRCHTIVLVDAGCDPDGGFRDLQNAIHKVRVDLGIRIEFAKDPFAASKNGKPAHWYEATIHYSDVDANAVNGTLVYIKPVVTGDEPLDVLAYNRRHPRFPHQTTADQFFNETQFESYRALGLHSIDQCPRIAELLS